jgi:hypothetical protein
MAARPLAPSSSPPTKVISSCAIVVTSSTVKNFDPSTVKKLDPPRVKKLDPSTVKKFDPSALGQATVEYVVHLSSIPICASSALPMNSVYAGGMAWASSLPVIQSIPKFSRCRSTPAWWPGGPPHAFSP